jgi:hypothetical protein
MADQNAPVLARSTNIWSVDRIVRLNLSAEQIGTLKANALDRANEHVAQICEDALAIVRGKDYEISYRNSRPSEPQEIVEAFFQGLSKYRQRKGMNSYPARIMHMVRNHGVIETIRLTGTQGDTRTMLFMASNDHLHYTSEWSVAHAFPSFFSGRDIEKAVKRLNDACLA